MKPQEISVRAFIIAIVITGIAVFALSWGFWKYQYPHGDDIPVKFIPLTTTGAPIGSRVVPEQRRIFALDFGQKFKVKYPDATVSTSKDLHTSLLIRGGMINEPFAVAMKDNIGIINDIREMGFKRLIMTDGKTAWVVDLKN